MNGNAGDRREVNAGDRREVNAGDRREVNAGDRREVSPVRQRFASTEVNAKGPRDVSLLEYHRMVVRRQNRMRAAMLIVTSDEWLGTISENLSERIVRPGDMDQEDWNLTKDYLRQLRRLDFSHENPHRSPNGPQSIAESEQPPDSMAQSRRLELSATKWEHRKPKVQLIESSAGTNYLSPNGDWEGYGGLDNLSKSSHTYQKGTATLGRSTVSETLRDKRFFARTKQPDRIPDSNVYKDQKIAVGIGHHASSEKTEVLTRNDMSEIRRTIDRNRESEDEFTREADELFPDGRYKIGGMAGKSLDSMEWDSIFPLIRKSEEGHVANITTADSDTSVNVLSVAYPAIHDSLVHDRAAWRPKNSVSPSIVCPPPNHPASRLTKSGYIAPDYSIFVASTYIQKVVKPGIPKPTIPVTPEKRGNLTSGQRPKKANIVRSRSPMDFDNILTKEIGAFPDIRAREKRRHVFGNIRRTLRHLSCRRNSSVLPQ